MYRRCRMCKCWKVVAPIVGAARHDPKMVGICEKQADGDLEVKVYENYGCDDWLDRGE